MLFKPRQCLRRVASEGNAFYVSIDSIEQVIRDLVPVIPPLNEAGYRIPLRSLPCPNHTEPAERRL
jgi:hypothetical protein